FTSSETITRKSPTAATPLMSSGPLTSPRNSTHPSLISDGSAADADNPAIPARPRRKRNVCRMVASGWLFLVPFDCNRRFDVAGGKAALLVAPVVKVLDPECQLQGVVGGV